MFENIAQAIEHLPIKHKALTLKLQHYQKKSYCEEKRDIKEQHDTVIANEIKTLIK
jgi:hypothetical protein